MESGKSQKINKRRGTFIPDSRVALTLLGQRLIKTKFCIPNWL